MQNYMGQSENAKFELIYNYIGNVLSAKAIKFP